MRSPRRLRRRMQLPKKRQMRMKMRRLKRMP